MGQDMSGSISPPKQNMRYLLNKLFKLNNPGRLYYHVLFVFLLGLAACTTPDTLPPTLAITSPASGSPVSGTTTIQLSASDDQGLASLQVFVRGKGSTERGVAIGSAAQEPYVLSWYTLGQPNLADLELVAIAKDYGANETESAAVTVKTQNSGVPSLQLLTAFTLAPDNRVAVASVNEQVTELLRVEDVLLPESPSVPLWERGKNSSRLRAVPPLLKGGSGGISSSPPVPASAITF